MPPFCCAHAALRSQYFANLPQGENVRKAYANGMQSVWQAYGTLYGTKS